LTKILPEPSPTSARSGFTLVELMIVTVLIAVMASIASPKLRAVLVRAHLSSVVADGKILSQGFAEFYAEGYAYPNAISRPYFDLTTFEPLRSMGFYQGDMFDRLNGGQADGFDSPDDRGSNQEFWVLLTLRIDPSYQVVVASSDNVPLAQGEWLEGVYTFRDGELIDGPGVNGGT